MKLLFKQIHNGAKFLPLHYTQSMDFATNKLQVILNNLSVKPNSVAAKYIERMLDYCGQKGVKDEVRYCATSLEAIVDFVTLNSNSGKNNYMVVSTEEEKDVLLEYTIQEATKVGNDDQHNLVCHKVNNPYVVFLCHNLRSTDVYSVSLVDAKGKQMNAIAVCHKDTSDWYPKHIAFQILKVKPGNKHICHFLSGDTIVWHRK
ncbi:BURP domain-containing protein 3 [Bienertia sinuspersici]